MQNDWDDSPLSLNWSPEQLDELENILLKKIESKFESQIISTIHNLHDKIMQEMNEFQKKLQENINTQLEQMSQKISSTSKGTSKNDKQNTMIFSPNVTLDLNQHKLDSMITPVVLNSEKDNNSKRTSRNSNSLFKDRKKQVQNNVYINDSISHSRKISLSQKSMPILNDQQLIKSKLKIPIKQVTFSNLSFSQEEVLQQKRQISVQVGDRRGDVGQIRYSPLGRQKTMNKQPIALTGMPTPTSQLLRKSQSSNQKITSKSTRSANKGNPPQKLRIKKLFKLTDSDSVDLQFQQQASYQLSSDNMILKKNSKKQEDEERR